LRELEAMSVKVWLKQLEWNMRKKDESKLGDSGEAY